MDGITTLCMAYNKAKETALELEQKNKNLEEELQKAVKYLYAGKKKFAPGTTNSDVDVFLEKHKNFIKE